MKPLFGLIPLSTGLLALHAATPVSPIRFENIAKQSGVDFVLHNSPTPEKHMIETMPGGIAVFDYDGDGRPDILLYQRRRDSLARKVRRPSTGTGSTTMKAICKFHDVTEHAGVAGAGYSMGAAAGATYDNDGHADLFVAGVNRNILYRNLGNGRFEDVTAKAGIRSGEWAVAAGWFDYDRDGKLDLWVVHYAKWSPSLRPLLRRSREASASTAIRNISKGCRHTLYRNRGDGTFEDVTARAGIAKYARPRHERRVCRLRPGRLPGRLRHQRQHAEFPVPQSGQRDVRRGRPCWPAWLSATTASLWPAWAPSSRTTITTACPTSSSRRWRARRFPLFRNAGKGNFTDATYAREWARSAVKHSGWGARAFRFQ